MRDRLVSFNGKEISYDLMGRPTTYKDDQYGWNNQGQLTSILKQDGKEISYLYDANGIRRKKTVDGIETTFITNGTQLLSMKTGNKTLVFRYVLNKLIGFNYNDGTSTKEYLYHRNIQGDILGIYDDEGKQVGGYAYDAYGNHVITLNVEEIATINPFRYRGYFYDEETKLYYLNARYYDPETGRFISPDILSILDESKGQINGLNLYMYCGNNPVMRVDPSGCAWWNPFSWNWSKIGRNIGNFFTKTIPNAFNTAVNWLNNNFIRPTINFVVNNHDIIIGISLVIGALTATMVAIATMGIGTIGIGMIAGGIFGAIGGVLNSVSTAGNIGQGFINGLLVGFFGGASVLGAGLLATGLSLIFNRINTGEKAGFSDYLKATISGLTAGFFAKGANTFVNEVAEKGAELLLRMTANTLGSFIFSTYSFIADTINWLIFGGRYEKKN